LQDFASCFPRALVRTRSAQFNLFPLPSSLPSFPSATGLAPRLPARWWLGHTVKDLPAGRLKSRSGALAPRSTSRLPATLSRGGPRN